MVSKRWRDGNAPDQILATANSGQRKFWVTKVLGAVQCKRADPAKPAFRTQKICINSDVQLGAGAFVA